MSVHPSLVPPLNLCLLYGMIIGLCVCLFGVAFSSWWDVSNLVCVIHRRFYIACCRCRLLSSSESPSSCRLIYSLCAIPHKKERDIFFWAPEQLYLFLFYS
eukprot:Rmarinus@m.6219